MQTKLIEGDGSEGSTETREYSEQNSHVRNDIISRITIRIV